ncbi:hypothetical protein ACFJGV_00290 [Cnuibacter sp. UC19_7]|uniref:hypothetical protein n=1 Tax=Cnuibacter sp. UC19_7 TaxID=3350166 RepID=UPI0036732135
MTPAERAVDGILTRHPSVRVVLSDAVFNDAYYHADGPDGGTLYVNAEFTPFIAAHASWKGTVITTEAMPD